MENIGERYFTENNTHLMVEGNVAFNFLESVRTGPCHESTERRDRKEMRQYFSAELLSIVNAKRSSVPAGLDEAEQNWKFDFFLMTFDNLDTSFSRIVASIQ